MPQFLLPVPAGHLLTASQMAPPGNGSLKSLVLSVLIILCLPLIPAAGNPDYLGDIPPGKRETVPMPLLPPATGYVSLTGAIYPDWK